jgi:UDP-N-acetylmuramoylalanine--D-glutamate ligase
VLDARLAISGRHHRLNLLLAATALAIMEVPAATIRRRLAGFGGVEHRLETVCQWRGVTFINDSAATIPEAALGAVSSLDLPIHLITGGTDKSLAFGLYEEIHRRAKTVNLLKGSASEQVAGLYRAKGLEFGGPWDDLELCLKAVIAQAGPGEAVLLSPGCASFGMFLNEFDRGQKFKALVRSLTASS